MANKGTTLVEMYNDKLFISKVNALLDQKQTLQYIADFAKSYNYDVSLNTIRNYRDKRQESIENNIPLDELIDKRRKSTNILSLGGKEVLPEDSQTGAGNITLTPEAFEEAQGNKKLISVTQVLEEMIQKGYNTMNQTEIIDPQLTLKAVDAYHRITGGTSGGLTLQGLQEIRMQQKAMETATAEVIMEYIPEALHEEVLAKMEEKQQAFYDNLDISGEGRRVREALEKAGIV